MLKYFLTLEIRNLIRNKFPGILKITGISLGFIAALLIAQYIRYNLSYDNFQTESSRKFLLQEQSWWGEYFMSSTTPVPLGEYMKMSCPEIESVVSVEKLQNQGYIKTSDGFVNSGLDEFAFVDDNFFSFFSFCFIAGNPEECFNSPSPAIISQRIADKFFPKSNALGNTITVRIDNRLYDFTITGVFENPPSNTNFNFEWISSIDYLRMKEQIADHYANWRENCQNYIMLKEGTNPDTLIAKLTKFYKTNNKDEFKRLVNIESKLQFVNIRQLNLFPEVRKRLFVFGTLGLLILVISLVNFILIISVEKIRSLNNRAINKISGAGKKEFLLQGILSAFVPVSLAMIIAILLLALTKNYVPHIFQDSAAHSGLITTGIFVLFLILFSSLTAGFIIMLILRNYTPVDILKNQFKRGKFGTFISNSLLTFQLLSFITLVAISFVIQKQINFMQNTDLGYNKEYLVSIKLSENDRKSYSLFKQELMNTGLVKSVSGTNCPPSYRL